jgi:hypothetical protein
MTRTDLGMLKKEGYRQTVPLGGNVDPGYPGTERPQLSVRIASFNRAAKFPIASIRLFMKLRVCLKL